MLRMSLFPETPGTLLRKIADLQAGDDAAVWADFVERYLPAVRAFIRLNGAPENDQDDLVQEVFVKLVGILRTSRYDAAKARFRTYLATLMRNLLVDYFRQIRSRETAVNGAEQMTPLPELGSDPGHLLDVTWRLAIHQAAVDHVLNVSLLAAQSKDIYRAYVLEAQDIGAVARRFDVSRNTVSKIKMRVNQMIAAIEASYCE